MKRTTLEMFREELVRTGRYETPPERMAPKPRAPGWWTTFSFSWGVFSVFPRCAVSENLGTLDTDKWAHYCFAALRKAEALGTKVTADGWVLTPLWPPLMDQNRLGRGLSLFQP